MVFGKPYKIVRFVFPSNRWRAERGREKARENTWEQRKRERENEKQRKKNKSDFSELRQIDNKRGREQDEKKFEIGLRWNREYKWEGKMFCEFYKSEVMFKWTKQTMIIENIFTWDIGVFWERNSKENNLEWKKEWNSIF